MSFDFDSLPEAEAARVRKLTERIGRRDVHRRRSWFGDGYDLFRVREIIAGKRFEAWVTEETPFSVRTAYNLADAAKMLFDAVGSAKFADLPPIKPSIAYLLAAGTTPQAVRDRFLPRLIEGVAVTLKEVRAALPPPAESEPETDDESKAALMREPSQAVIALARSLRLPERRLIRTLAKNGQLDMIVLALDWIDADPAKLTAETADRLADHAAEAIRQTISADLQPGDDESGADDDEDPPNRLH